MKYISKPYTIKAFQLEPNIIDLRLKTGLKSPDWFKVAYEQGVVMTTLSDGYQYVSVFMSNGKCVKALMNDWICLNENTGEIFVETEASFKNKFERF